MYSIPIADVFKSTSYEEAFMAEDRIVRNDVLAVGILGPVSYTHLTLPTTPYV